MPREHKCMYCVGQAEGTHYECTECKRCGILIHGYEPGRTWVNPLDVNEPDKIDSLHVREDDDLLLCWKCVKNIQLLQKR